MSLEVNEDGTIILYQGDTGEVVVNNLPTIENYKAYFGIRDEKRNQVGAEVLVNTNKQESISFRLTSDLTDKLEVPNGKKFATYYYGIKLVTPGSLNEDTLFVEGNTYGSLNRVIVYPKKVEGV